MENDLKQIIKFALFHADAPSSFSSEDDLIKELEQQTMLLVLGTNVDQFPFSDKQQAYCINYIMGCFAFTHELLYKQSQLVNLLQQNGIMLAILKGSAAAMNYPELAYIELLEIDVDFLVREADFLKVYELLKKNGYTLAYDEDNIDYHYTLKKENVTFELYKYPAGLPHGESRKYLMDIFNADLEITDTVEIEGYQVPVLPTVANGLVWLLHIKKRLTGGLGLRQIADWMIFVDKHLEDSVWETEFKDILSKSGLETLARTVTRMSQIQLGLTDKITWCSDASEELCNELQQYAMEKGNLGHKEVKDGLGRRFAKDSVFNPIKLLKKFQHDGLCDWKACHKYRFLRLFAWPRQLVYYITYIKHHRKHIASDVKIGKARTKTIDQLLN